MNQATTQPMPEITATELKQRLDNGEDIQIIDVRDLADWNVRMMEAGKTAVM